MSRFKQPTIYARRERTTDIVALGALTPAQITQSRFMDTVFYHDKKARRFYVRKPWHNLGHPTKTGVFRNLNCFRYRVVILPRT